MCEGGVGVEQVLAQEDRVEIARMLYELMQAQFPGRVIVLRNGERLVVRSDGVS
jgi:hypothetical protein